MAASPKQKTPLHLRLTCDEWLKIFNQLDRAELGVFYYIKTQDPFGDRVVEANSSAIAALLGIHRTSVSRALKNLCQKGLISLEIVTARVSVRVEQKLVCMDAQEMCMDAQEVCMDAQEVCMDAQEVCMDAQEHNIDCARFHTNSDLIKTNSDQEDPPIVPQIFAEPGGGDDFVLAEVVLEEKEVVQVKTTSDRVQAEISPDEKVYSLVPIVPARENNNQIQKLSPIQEIFEESGKVLSHGIEYKTWIQFEMGDVIKHYRQSGRALAVSPNDIDPDFKSFTAANGNSGKGLKLAAAQGWIVNCEKDPLRWGELRDLVAEWLLAKTTGDRHINVAQTINQASRPPIKLNLNF